MFDGTRDYTNAAGETSVYAYNAAGQLLSETNALGQVTTYNYNGTGDLLTVTNADHAVQATYTYDAFDRIESYTDSEGWTVRVAYDAADRVTRLTYPDGTADLFTYDKLDPASYKDRDGRLWTYTFDAERRLTAITDPSEHQVLLGYDEAGNVTSLTDANSNVTQWAYDLESRPTVKTYADTSTTTSTYETTTSRLKSVLDALGQTKTYGYAKDNRLTAVSYTGAVNPTPNVTLAYDPFFPRLVSMADGIGTTSYSYLPVGSPGGLAVATEDGPLASDTIDYGYDALGRVVSRTVQGAGQENWAFDDIGRLIAHDSDLGNFTLSYLGETDQITERALTGSTLATSWSYLTNHDDRRLSEISNVGLSPSQYSTFHYVMTPEQLITSITQTSDALASYPPLKTQSADYNDLNQLTLLDTQSLTYDANGNLLSDGQREYQWDAENRLLSITYPAESGKKTEFAYDGLSRRTEITNTPAGGGAATTTLYTWCSSAICQARDQGNDPVREYLAEGEYLPGVSPRTYYYSIDQIGSIRRTFVDASTAPEYDYDPYGVMTSGAAPVADLGYAGMFGGTESGLYLTQYRAYDPSVGRWVSRDPIDSAFQVRVDVPSAGPLSILGTSSADTISSAFNALGLSLQEPSDLSNEVNLYTYVASEPVFGLDPRGLAPVFGNNGDLISTWRNGFNWYGIYAFGDVCVMVDLGPRVSVPNWLRYQNQMVQNGDILPFRPPANGNRR